MAPRGFPHEHARATATVIGHAADMSSLTPGWNTWNGASYDPPAGTFSILEKVGAIFRLTLKDQTVYDFDSQGLETTIDYRRMLRIVADAGYRGFVGVEYEGQRLSEAEGIRATRDLILRIGAELATEVQSPSSPS